MSRVDGMARGARRRWRSAVRLINRDGTTFTRPSAWSSVYVYPATSAVTPPSYTLPATLATSEATWLSSQYNPNVKEWLKDLTGHGHHMRLGSSGRAAIVGGALVLPTSYNGYATTPDHAALDIVGDIDIQVKMAMDDWTGGGAFRGIIGKWVAGNASYGLQVNTTGMLELFFTSDGINPAQRASTVAPSSVVANGAVKWVRATMDVDNGSTQHVVTFYTSDDGTTWTQLGATVTTAGVASIFSGNAALQIGVLGTGNGISGGRVYRAIVKNGIAGTTVFDADFSSVTDGTPWFVESTGKRVTVMPTRAAVVGGALWLPGSGSQYASTATNVAFDITGDMDVIVKVAADDYTPGATQTLVARRGTTDLWQFRINNSNQLEFLSWDSGGIARTYTCPATMAGFTDGSDLWLKVSHDVDNGASGATASFYTSTDGSAWTLLGAATGALHTRKTGTNQLQVGVAASSEAIPGKVYRAIVKDGIGGTAVFDCDFSTWSDGDGMGGYPKNDSTGKAVSVLSDTTGADTNDPKWLKYSSTAGLPESKGLYLPGVASNYATTPDAAALDVTGDITLDVEVSADDWTPAGVGVLLAKDGASDPDRSYHLALNATGTLGLNWFTLGTGASQVTATSTVAVPAVDGQRLWVRASLDVNGNTSGLGWRVKFFTSADGTTWTQLGSDVTGGTVATSIAAGVAQVGVGALSGGTFSLAGRYFRARIYNGYFDGTTQGGSAVFDVDFSTATEPYATFTATTGQTVTINRPNSGRRAAVVDRPTFLFGTDDYMECADHDTLDFTADQPFTLAVALRRYGAPPGAGETYLAKKSAQGAGSGWLLWEGSSNTAMDVGDPSVEQTLGPGHFVDGRAAVLAGVAVAGSYSLYLDAVSGAANPEAIGSLASTEVVRIGRLSGAGASYADMGFIGSAIWRTALSGADLVAIDTEFGTNV